MRALLRLARTCSVCNWRSYVRLTHGAASQKPEGSSKNTEEDHWEKADVKKGSKAQAEEQNVEEEEEEENRADIWDMDRVRRNSAEVQEGQDLERMAQWVTSWMLPWERDHLDGRRRELLKWEEWYWLSLVVLGGAGLSWEIYVAQNSRLFKTTPKEGDK